MEIPYRSEWVSLRSGDRLIIGENLNKQEELCHITRYEFASNYVKDKIVLDAGCGTGYGSRILKHNGASLVIGVDYSEEAISYARKNYGTKDVLFYTCNLSGDIDFTKEVGINHFDVIASIEVIEHTPSPDIYLSNLDKLLTKGGFIILSTPNRLTDKHVLCHEKEFSIEELHTYIHTYIQLNQQNFTDRECFLAN